MTDIASIGFKMETDDVARGIKSLETLAQQGPKVEKALDGVEKTAAKAGKSLKSIGEGAGKGLDEVGRAAPKVADGVGRVAKSADDAKKALAGMGASTAGLGSVAASAGQAGRGLASMAVATSQAGAGLAGFGSGLKSAQQMLREMQSQALASAQATSQMASATTAAVASMNAMAKAQADATRTAQEMARVFQAVGVHAKDGAAGVGRMGEASNGLGAGMGLAVRGVQAFLGLQLAGWAKDSAAALFQASAAAERLKIGLDFASARGGAEEMAYLRKATYDLGLSFQGTAQAYMQFQAAAKGTTIEGDKARAVFESISKASAVMGLTADQSSGALLALQQMISKGSVSSEELKQQLGERLPGAFQIAARSMGVTTAELGKMLEMGQVVAEDFLPKFAAELEKSLGDAPEKAAQRLDASVNRANDAWTRLKQNVGDSGVSQFWAGQLNVLTDGMGNFNNAIEQASASGKGFGGQLMAAAGAALQFINPVNAIGYSALETGNQLAEAEKKLQALKDAGAQSSSNLMLREAFGHAQRLVDKLREAAQAQKNLAGAGAGATAAPGGDPYNDGSQYASYTQAQKEREDAARRLAEITARQSGITKQFTDDLKTYQDALKAGVMTEKEYAAAVTEANKKRYESTEAGKEAAKQSKAGASAAGAEQSTYATLVATIKAKIAANDAELFAAGKLTESEKLRVQLQAQLDSGAKKLSAAHRAEAKDLLAKLKTQEDEEKAIKRALALNDERVASAEEMAKAMADLDKQVDAARLSIHEYSVGVQDSIEMTNLEASTLGMNAVARQTLIEQLRIEQDLRQRIQKIKDAPYKTEEARQADVDKITAEAMKAKANAQTKAYVSEWEKAFDQTSQALTDALMRGGKDGGELLRDYFRTLILRPIIKAIVDPIAAPITSGIQSMLGQGSGSSSASGGMPGGSFTDWSTWGSKASGWASDASFKLVTNGWEGMGSSMLGLSRTITSVDTYLKDIPGMSGGIGSAAGYVGALYSLSQGKVGAAAGAAIGTYIFPGIGTMIGSMLGGLLDGLDDSGTKHMGAGAMYSKATGVQEGASIYNQATFGMGHRDEHSADMQAGISGIAQSLGQTLDAFAMAFGKSAGYSVATAFADDSSDDGSWGSLKILDQLGSTLVDWSDNRASKWAPREFADGKEGYEEYLKAVAVDVKAAFLAMDLPEWSDSLLKAATDLDSLNAALQQIATVKSVFDGLGKTMGMFADLSGELQTQLLAASGGIEALGTNAGAFYQSFYSDGDRAQTQRELQMGALGDMGLYIDPFQGDAAKEMLRLTVEEAMASGQVALAGKLLAMSASFVETADYGQTLLDATATAAKDAAQEAAAAATSWTGLGKVLAMFSGLSAEVQSGLVTASGGMDSLVSNVGAFNQGFYSEGERALSQRAQQMAALAEMGLYIDPAEGEKAKELFRSTVEGAMASGQTELAAKLLAMSGEFASTADYAKQFFDDLAQSAVQSMSGAWSNFGTMAGLAAQYTGNTSGLSQQLGVVQGSYASATTTDGRVAALQQIINLEQGLWNGQQAARQAEAAAATARANAAREQVNAAKQLLTAAQGLGSYAKSLGFSEASGLGETERLAALDSERRDLLAKARAGDTGAMQDLQGVTGNYLTLAQQMAVSQQDYSVLSGRIAAELAATAAIQEASASSQVSQLERQIAAAESVASSAAEQFKVSAATQKLIDDLLVESATAFETEATLTQKLIDQGVMTTTALQSLPAELAGAIGTSLIPAIAGLASAMSSAAAISVPQFAEGGFHAGGLRIVGERGPELEATGPSRVWNQSQLAGALGGNNNAALVAAVDRLTAQNARMSAELAEIKASTSKLAEQFDSVSAGGNALLTEAMA
ncbi:tape measure protein [Acidovorax sp. CCYZU-2555]|uniref:tape measure protein n=1 Tax=Acidovorax sp. CCYZU-2555 TaxID=2835042 RepID=UPI001BCF4FA8|nr:tape measure protein [Acidovorax sp. CCYZU-2555]MBS7777706.1 tape measure protein [Acidovorax sp. CCYZU-2555]